MVKEAVFKITENCPCDCAFCDSKEKYEKILKKKTLSFEEWKSISDKLIKNGLEVVVISGGEPLLNSEITFKLIDYLHEHNIYVVLNTSGIVFKNNNLLEKLKMHFPNLLVFSIDSAYAAQHNENRRTNGVFEKVIELIDNLNKDVIYPIAIRTVITKSNYKQLPKIIEDFNNRGIDCIKLTNIENDVEGKFRLDLKDLECFDKVVRKEIIQVLNKCEFEDEELRNESIKKIKNLFNRNRIHYEKLSIGHFSPNLVGKAKCDLDGHFFAVQSNGDVLLCCEAEHHYVPLLGNLLKSEVNEILNSEEFLNFANNRLDYCITCTQHHNLQINFSRKGNKVERR